MITPRSEFYRMPVDRRRPRSLLRQRVSYHSTIMMFILGSRFRRPSDSSLPLKFISATVATLNMRIVVYCMYRVHVKKDLEGSIMMASLNFKFEAVACERKQGRKKDKRSNQAKTRTFN